MAFSTTAADMTVRVSQSGVPSVNTEYQWTTPESIPRGFSKVCDQNGWKTFDMWKKLNGERNWWRASQNEAYIYYNGADGHWWIDEPNGLGVYIAPGSSGEETPPVNGWKALKPEYHPLPTVEVVSTTKTS